MQTFWHRNKNWLMQLNGVRCKYYSQLSCLNSILFDCWTLACFFESSKVYFKLLFSWHLCFYPLPFSSAFASVDQVVLRYLFLAILEPAAWSVVDQFHNNSFLVRMPDLIVLLNHLLVRHSNFLLSWQSLHHTRWSKRSTVLVHLSQASFCAITKYALTNFSSASFLKLTLDCHECFDHKGFHYLTQPPTEMQTSSKRQKNFCL